MNSGLQILLILAVMVLFVAVVVAPILGRILAAPRFGQPPCAPCGPAGMPAFPFGDDPIPPSPLARRSASALRKPRPGQAGPWDLAEDSDDDGKTDRLIDIGRVEGRLRASAAGKINALIDRHPQAAAAVVRNWLHRSE